MIQHLYYKSLEKKKASGKRTNYLIFVFTHFLQPLKQSKKIGYGDTE